MFISETRISAPLPREECCQRFHVEDSTVTIAVVMASKDGGWYEKKNEQRNFNPDRQLSSVHFRHAWKKVE
jgi:hypothetical protein